jgi:rhodanese-related sulfurtransferase
MDDSNSISRAALSGTMPSIMLAAAAFGFAFNSVSAPGLSFTPTEEVAAPSAPARSQTNHGLANKTLALSFAALSASTPASELPATNEATPLPTARRYANETRSVSFEIDGFAAPAIAKPVEFELSENSRIRTVKWVEVKPLLAAPEHLLIDARPAENFLANHIPGAISIPSETPDADLEAMMSAFPKDRLVTVYCGSDSCHLSRTFAQRLVKLGFTNVQEMPGGLVEYLGAEKEPSK